LKPIYAGVGKHLELQAMEVHDLMLAKIERNSARDRYDLLSLAQAGLLDPAVLQQRYIQELRPFNPEIEREIMRFRARKPAERGISSSVADEVVSRGLGCVERNAEGRCMLMK
jgi:hypothetical protein